MINFMHHKIQVKSTKNLDADWVLKGLADASNPFFAL